MVINDACLLEFFDKLTRLNQMANSSQHAGTDETEMWRQVGEFDEILAPFGYRLVTFADQMCFVPVKQDILRMV